MSETTGSAETKAGDELLAQLADEFLRRHRAGEHPSLDEYAAKHPDLAERIRDLFPAMMAMEQPRAAATVDFAPSAERVGATIGRYKAVAKVGSRTFRGFPAWWLARTYHMSQIPGTMRKVRAVADWTVGLPFRRDIAEVGSIGHPRPLRADEYAASGTHRA